MKIIMRLVHAPLKYSGTAPYQTYYYRHLHICHCFFSNVFIKQAAIILSEPICFFTARPPLVLWQCVSIEFSSFRPFHCSFEITPVYDSFSSILMPTCPNAFHCLPVHCLPVPYNLRSASNRIFVRERTNLWGRLKSEA